MKKNDLFGHLTNETIDDLSDTYKYSWVEDSFVFDKKVGRQVSSSGTNECIGNIFDSEKFFYSIVFLGIIFFIFFFRIFFLQLWKGDEYTQFAERNRQKIIPIPSERGLIFDRNGIQLTENVPKFALTLIPQNLPQKQEEREKIIKRLAEITGFSENEVRTTIEEYKDYSFESIVIKDNLDYDSALLIQIESAGMPGIEIQRGSKRFYVSNFDDNKQKTSSTVSSLSHIIGYEGKLSKDELTQLHNNGYLPSDYIGKTGIEKIYEGALRGAYGRKRVEVNSAGKEQNVLAEESPLAGDYLYLSIDAKMQNELEKIMNHYLSLNNKSRASAIVMDPRNGEILSLVSLPSYNNNDFSGGISFDNYKKLTSDENFPLFNRAIAGTYPSGSSIKPAIASIALELGIINENTAFLSNGGLRIGQWFFPDWLAGGHGMTNVRKSLAQSVNTFYYYIGGGYGNFVGMGVEKLTAGLKKYGFSSKLGIDLPGEAEGFLPSKEWKEKLTGEKWYVGDTYNLSIGQGQLLVTPLQIASMTATIANGGTIYKPRVAKILLNSVSKEKKEIKTEIIATNVMSANNLKIVRLGMKDCVEYGSCRRLGSLPFVAAGKTGTAQWNKNKANHAWFTSFAPFDNPEIVVTIMVEEGVEGSGIGSQIAYDFYKWWGKYKNNPY